MQEFSLFLGDCLATMRSMPNNSVDSIITDPPYEIGFLGRAWDSTGVAYNVEIWREALRVLKPGGHLLAFSAPRTYHKICSAIENAGFEIRDQMMWLFANGVPKSHDVSAALDKCPANREEVLRVTNFLRNARIAAGKTNAQIDALFGTNGMAGHWTTSASQPLLPSVDQWKVLKEFLQFSGEMDGVIVALNGNKCASGSPLPRRDIFSNLRNLYANQRQIGNKQKKATEPTTEAAKRFQGWGTALKPAHEPICVARKPLNGTVAQNVAQFGTGAINITASRIPHETPGIAGRWPANILHDGEVFEDFRGKFFFSTKATKADREAGNTHPTVKPTELMAHLCNLVTPPGGTVLDPFTGSGSTGKAAVLNGFNFIGIEICREYLDIAHARIGAAARSVLPA